MNHFGPRSKFFNVPHRIRCKGLKGPKSLSVTEVTAAFSTSFFTALLKRVHHRWKHSCTTLIGFLNPAQISHRDESCEKVTLPLE
jgi:hypothetical protein